MGTGACGIDCSVCRLHALGVCSSCGSGVSSVGRRKLDAQRDLFGMACTLLECATEKKIAYCTRDCPDFPCDHYVKGPYPYSAGYLDMQERRIAQKETSCKTGATRAVTLLWDELDTKSSPEVCARTLADPTDDGGYVVKSLCDVWEVRPEETEVRKSTGGNGGDWDRMAPFLILVYLNRGGKGEPSGEMIAPRDVLPGRDFFSGDHRIDVEPMELQFGSDAELFRKSAEALGGRKTERGDASAVFDIFPKFTAEYILWIADDEFPARVTVLVDGESINLFPVDAMDVALNLLCERLVMVSKDFI